MNAILSIAIKDLKLLYRDKMGMFFILVFPILMGLFFGTMMGGPSSGSSRSMKLGIVDEDQSEMSAKFVESLNANESLDLRTEKRDEAIEKVRKGKLVGVIIVPAGFGETAGILWKDPPTIQLGMDPSRSAEGAMTQGFVMKSMGQIVGDRFQNPASMRPLIKDLRKQLKTDDNVPPAVAGVWEVFTGSLDTMFDSLEKLQTEEEKAESESNDGTGSASRMQGLQFANVEAIDVTYTPEPGSMADLTRRIRSKWDLSFPQAMIWGVLGCVAGFAVSIVRERSLGTMTRLQVAPISRAQIITGKAFGCFISVVGVLLVLACIACLLGMRPKSPGLLIMAMLLIAFAFVGMMVVMSVLGKTEEAVGGATWAINTIMAMFGGGMIPVLFMPDFMKTLSNLSPVKWAILSLEGAIWRDFNLVEMMRPGGVLLGIGVVGLTLGTFLLRRE